MDDHLPYSNRNSTSTFLINLEEFNLNDNIHKKSNSSPSTGFKPIFILMR